MDSKLIEITGLLEKDDVQHGRIFQIITMILAIENEEGKQMQGSMTTLKERVADLQKLNKERTQGEWRLVKGMWNFTEGAKDSGIEFGNEGGFSLHDAPNPENNIRFFFAAPEMMNVIGELGTLLAKAMQTLDKLSRLGNGAELGNSDGNRIAQQAFSEINAVMEGDGGE